MRFNKKIMILLAFVSLFLCVITLQDTYAKYTSHVNGDSNISIARWRILVNNFDIKEELTTSNLITPVFSGNENVKDGVIAPTSTGYFDIIIDSTDTDVSFTYNITVNSSEDSIVDDMVITGCSLNGQSVGFADNTAMGTIMVNSATKINTLRVYIEWNDGEGSTMDNAADTDTTRAADSVAKILVDAHFTQAR